MSIPAIPWTSALSHREREVVALYLDGMEAKNIGLDLGISVKTVGVHLYRIRHKMRLHGLRFVRQVTAEPRVNPDSTSNVT